MNGVITLILTWMALSAIHTAPAKYTIQGDLTEACPCNSTCPCHFGSDATFGHCEGSLVFHVQKGQYQDVSLDGLTVIAVSWFGKNMKAAMGKMPGRLYIDERATPAQRHALESIFMEVFRPLIGKVYPSRYVPIEVTNHGDYSTISSPVLKLDIIPTKDAEGNPTSISHPPVWLPLPMEYIATSRVYRFSDSSLGKQWSYQGRHANYAPFEFSSDKMPTGSAGKE